MSFLTTNLANLIQNNSATKAFNRLIISPCVNAIQIRNYAARKGTRERRRKAKASAKVKVEVKKVGFIPHNLRDREKILAARPSRKFDDSWKRDPIDDVFAMKYYKWIVYPFVDAVKAHRETHHPDMYNQPNANLHAKIELNMQGEKKTRFIENFKRVLAIPYKFDIGEERTVIAFAKNVDSQQEATEAGAQLAGGVDLIKQIQNGQVILHDFQYILAHPDIMPELVALRGVMRKKFPNLKAGTLGPDLKELVDTFLHGINYQAVKDEYEKDFGEVDAILGTLNMDEKHLEANFAALVNDIYSQKPKREGGFITRCLLYSPPSREQLKVAHEPYISAVSSKSEADDEEGHEEKDDEGEKVAL